MLQADDIYRIWFSSSIEEKKIYSGKKYNTDSKLAVLHEENQNLWATK